MFHFSDNCIQIFHFGASLLFHLCETAFELFLKNEMMIFSWKLRQAGIK